MSVGCCGVIFILCCNIRYIVSVFIKYNILKIDNESARQIEFYPEARDSYNNCKVFWNMINTLKIHGVILRPLQFTRNVSTLKVN